MNHQEIYQCLIQKAKSENRIKHQGIYYESHHIIPRCLGGTNKKENRVLLTAREHFIAHKLLTHVYKNNYKILSAFNLMTFMNKRKYGVTSRDYKYLKELYINTPLDEKTLIKRKNIVHTKEWNKKISESLKNHEVLEETKIKISTKNTGRKYSDEVKKNYKRGNKGKNLGVKHSAESIHRTSVKLKGISRSFEFRNKISMGSNNSKKECEFCHKNIPLNIYNRCHGKKCKLNA